VPKDPRLILQASIPDNRTAIGIGGGKGDSCRLALDLYSEDPAEFARLFEYRGERLIVTIIKEDDIHKGGSND
jgi:hypothetical protein